MYVFVCVHACAVCHGTKPTGQYTEGSRLGVSFPCAFVDVNHHGKVFFNMASSLPLRKGVPA